MERRPFPAAPAPAQPQPLPLEARIAAALGSATGIKAADISALYGELATAITSATSAADQARANALDPTVDNPAAARARRDDCAFQLERLKAALAPLQARYTELRKAERRTEWREQYAEVKSKRDAAAAKLKEIYTELIEQLVKVLERAKDIDQEVARINSTAPSGEHDRLLSVECAARGVIGVGPNGALSLLTELRLPHWNAPGLAWPPPAPVITAEMVVPAGMLSHPADHWHVELQQRDARRQQEAKRVAQYHAQREREKEDMENAARARAEQERRRQAL
jgi:hypothetical protein